MTTTTYRLSTEKTWMQTYGDLEVTFSKWRVKDWEVRSPGRSSRAAYQSLEDRTVFLRFTRPSGEEVILTYNAQERAVDNLRVLYLAVEAMRKNELRGIGGLLREAYLQLAAPAKSRDPWEVLGIRPDASPELIKSAYQVAAKKAHPDAGGSDAQMREVNAAYERLMAQS